MRTPERHPAQPPTRRRRWSVTTSSPPTCALVEAVTRHAGAEVVEDLVALGAEAGTAEAREHGMLANEHHPELTTYDRYGNRIDEVEFHPSWHWLMERAVGHGLQAAPWEQQEAGARTRTYAGPPGFMAWSHTEPGHGCPISMTYAAVPALRADDALAKEWTPLLASTIVRPRRPAASTKARRAGRDGDDREAGRLRRPRQRHRGAADRRSTASTPCTGTSGSPPRR